VDGVEYYLQLNRCGRRLLGNDNHLPLGFWPHLLANIPGGPMGRSVMLHFLKTLSGTAGLFKKAGRPIIPKRKDRESDKEGDRYGVRTALARRAMLAMGISSTTFSSS